MTNGLSDTEIIDLLYENLEWDGWGWWLPEVCIAEPEIGRLPEPAPRPTVAEFRKRMSAFKEELEEQP